MNKTLNPLQEKRDADKKTQQHQDEMKKWLSSSNPKDKLSLTLSNWKSHTFPKNTENSYQVESDRYYVKQLYIPLNSHYGSSKKVLYYTAHYNPNNIDHCQDIQSTSRIGDSFCQGKKETSRTKNNNGIFTQYYFHQCRPDIFKKAYMTNDHCGKLKPGLLGHVLGDDSGGNICYMDKDGLFHPTQDAADSANKAIVEAKKQPSIQIMLYRRCLYDAHGTYNIEYMAELNKKNKDQAHAIFDSIKFKPSKTNG